MKVTAATAIATADSRTVSAVAASALAWKRTGVRAVTWANFPGLRGKIYRAIVIGTGGHRVVLRWTLQRIAAALSAGRGWADETEADYSDAFEVTIADGDVRSAEQAFRDALGDEPGALGAFVPAVHSHLLRLRLGPYSSPGHVIGWAIVRSDHDELVLEAGGPLMRGQLTLRREDGRHAVLTTRLHYRHKIAARMLWVVVGPLHRALAPRLMKRSARRAVSPAAGG